MSNELIDVMDHSGELLDYFEIMDDNIFNKKTESSKKKTIKYLEHLYSFKKNNSKFLCLEDYWNKIEDYEKPLLAFLFASSVDYLIEESIDFVKSVKIESKANIELFESNIEHHHPNRFTSKTLRSVSQNVASSWKQAGYILGKVKNIRKLNPPGHCIASFAFLIAYLDGLRGDYLFNHPTVRALDASREETLSLLKAASDRELLSYNRSGASIVISFDGYLKNLSNV